MIDYADIFTIILGSFTTIIAFFLGFRFMGYSRFGNVVGYLVIALAYAMLSTTVFALAAYFGWLKMLDGYIQTALRLGMFFTAMAAILNARFSMRKSCKKK